MEFLQFAQLLFDNQLLASEGTVRDVLAKYEYAMVHGYEQVGLVKRESINTMMNTKVFKGTDGTRIGILPVKGALIYEETQWEAMCGMTSYEGLVARAEKMILEMGAEHIILELNSGGGMAYGCFESAQHVRNLADKHDVKITAYVDGVAFSGGYAWCCIADEVIVNPMGKVGSIGVVLPLVNTSEMDKKEGIERIYITAGKSKVPFDKDGKFTKEAISDIQAGVNETYAMFVDHVADMRKMNRDDVIDTEAKTFGTKEALKLGLIDQVMTKEQFYEHLGNFNGDSTMSIKVEGEKTKVEGDSPVHTALVGQITDLQSKVTGFEGQITQLTADKQKLSTDLTAAQDRIKELEGQVSVANKAAEEATAKSREARISAFVAVDAVQEHMDFVEGFSDEKFDKYVSRLEKESEKVEQTFVEQGEGADSGDTTQAEISVQERMVTRMRERNKTK
ncbi:S49 family peptidase [Acinetobacter baumannii]|uniref:S49 family peptidase n=1 Tax=Acinetobacter baumannii TaxID=470 RepID=UPI003672ADD8